MSIDLTEARNVVSSNTNLNNGLTHIGSVLSAALDEIAGLRAELTTYKLHHAAQDREIEGLRAELADQDGWRYSHDEIEAACGGECAQDVRKAVLRRREFINTSNAAEMKLRLKSACNHEWTDARNELIKSGEMCPKCGEVRAGNPLDTTDRT